MRDSPNRTAGGQAAEKSRTENKAATDEKEPNPAVAETRISSTGKVFGNVLSLGSGEIIARVIALLAVGILARKLGPEGFGIIGFATALFGYLSIAVTAGFSDIGAREVARRPHRASEIAFSVILVRIVLASIIFAALGLAIWFLDGRQTIKLVVLLMGLTLFSLAIDTAWVYRALERNRQIGMSLIAGQGLYLIALLLLVKDAGDILLVPAALFAGELGAALLLVVPLYRLKKIKLNVREGLRILAGSYYWTVSRLMRLINGTFDVVIIGFVMNERAVGLYTAPYRICFALLAISVAVHTSYLPPLARAMSQGTEAVSAIAERSINLAAAISAPLVIGGMILAAPLLQIMFGAEYAEGAGAFQLLLLSIGLVFLHGAQHNVFLVCERTKTEMVIFSIGAGVNVGLNLAVIPHYGLIGAATVTAIAEGLTLLIGLFVISRMGIRLNFFRAVWRPIAAALLMGTVLFALGTEQFLILSLAVGAACYVLFLVILRGIPQDARLYLRSVTTFIHNLRMKA